MRVLVVQADRAVCMAGESETGAQDSTEHCVTWKNSLPLWTFVVYEGTGPYFFLFYLKDIYIYVMELK